MACATLGVGGSPAMDGPMSRAPVRGGHRPCERPGRLGGSAELLVVGVGRHDPARGALRSKAGDRVA